MAKPAYLKLKNGELLAYHKIEGNAPGVVFLGGFRSDMTGEKAMALEVFCQQRGHAFVRFDYRGHGQSGSKFADCTIGTWKEDALSVISKLTEGPQILVGSSMGGWISLLAASEKPMRVAGIICIAAAPDFTERIFHERFNDAQRDELIDKGVVMVPSDMGEPYPITAQFIAEGRDHLILHREIPVYCPVRLLQGMKDDVVPWEVSFAINEKLASQDVKTILVENGDHRLSTPDNIKKILSVTAKMMDSLAEKQVRKPA